MKTWTPIALDPVVVVSEPPRVRNRIVEGFRLVVDLQLWVSGAASALAAFAGFYLGGFIDSAALGIVFFASLVIYNVDSHFDRRRAGDRARRHLVVALLGTLSLLGCLAFASHSVAVVVIPGLLLCLLYGAPVRWGRNRYRLKDVPGLKAVFVAGALTAATILVPLLSWGGPIAWERLVLLGSFFFQITLTNVLLFDLCDRDRDRRDGTVTWPLRWGARRTRFVLGGGQVLWLFAAPTLAATLGVPLPPAMWILPSCLLLLVVVLQPATTRIVHDLAVDGSVLALLVFVFVR